NPRSLERGFPVGSRQVAVRTGPLVLEAAGNGPAPLTCRRRDRVRSASSRLAAARWTGRWWKGSIGTAERCRSVELRHRLDQFLGGHGAARSSGVCIAVAPGEAAHDPVAVDAQNLAGQP